MTNTAARAGKLLILSRRAGSMNPDVERRLRAAFSDHLVIDFDPEIDIEQLAEPSASIVVAGGDGTVEFVVRKLADSDHPLAILPLGTYNNLAHALGIPVELEKAIQAARNGRPHGITLGRVNGHVFVEACAVGLFGDAIVLGDAAKDLHFGEVAERLRRVIEAQSFEYELSGDLAGRGSAMSLVFSNTASIGSQLPVGSSNPVEPYLEFSADAGRSVADIVARVVASAVLQKHAEDATGRLFRFRSVDVRTQPAVRVYADNQLIGETPADVAAEVSALKVILPAAGDHK